MVSSIGATDSVKPRTTGMNRKVVETAVKNAYNTYFKNQEEYSNHMATFYREGKKNPTLAKIIFYDTVRDAAIKENEDILGYERAVGELKETPTMGIIEPMIKDAEVKMHGSLSGPMKIKAAIKAYDAVSTEMSDRLSEEVQPLREEFEKEFKSLYPTSGEARQRAIIEYKVSETGKDLSKAKDYEFFARQVEVGEVFKPIGKILDDTLNQIFGQPREGFVKRALKRVFSRAKKVK